MANFADPVTRIALEQLMWALAGPMLKGENQSVFCAGETHGNGELNTLCTSCFCYKATGKNFISAAAKKTLESMCFMAL